jgi:CheY-like chemotaxis protein
MQRAEILLVQADFLGAERLRLLLEQARYSVVGIAGRTAEAIELVELHQPSLAIVDMVLEIDVDGIRTATELVRRFALKVLITTGFPDFVTPGRGHRAAGLRDRQEALRRRRDPGGGRPLPRLRSALLVARVCLERQRTASVARLKIRRLVEGELPASGRFVVAQDVGRAVGAPQLEVAMVRADPGIEQLAQLDRAAVEPQPPGRLFAAVAGVALDPDDHDPACAVGVPSGWLNALRNMSRN